MVWMGSFKHSSETKSIVIRLLSMDFGAIVECVPLLVAANWLAHINLFEVAIN